MTDNLRQLPLVGLHEQAGARFGGFAGWRMPLTYPAGVMQEHQHTRAHAGLFDISHMKLIELSGPGAARLLARISPFEPEALAQGHGKYSFLLNEAAGILDDIIVTRLGPNRFMVVANAGNAAADIEHINGHAEGIEVKVDPLDRGFLAIQGPDAAETLKKAGMDGAGLTFMTATEPRPGWFLSRTGYTGEDGFEIGVPVDEGEAVANALLADSNCHWTGLAARDSLRLEAGLCLHGQDIDANTTPVDAGLLWAIPKSLRQGGGYVGARALQEAIEAGPRRKRVGLKPAGRQPVRAGTKLFDADGKEAGQVTSGGFGPSAGHPVAMGYVRPDLAGIDTEISAEVRGNRVPVVVHRLPFTPHNYHKG